MAQRKVKPKKRSRDRMAQITKKVPRHPDCDQTLQAVLEEIQFRNQNQRLLTSFSVGSAEVVLNFESSSS